MQKLSGLFLFIVLISGTFSSGFAFAQVGPVAENDFYSVNEDTLLTVDSLGVLTNDTNTDSDIFLAIIQTSTEFGTLNLNSNGTFTYQPNLNFASIDSFSYVTNNGTHNSNNATVTISVIPINDAPIAQDDVSQTQQNVQTSIDVLENDSDVEDDSLNIILVVDPTVTKGTVELSDSKVLFTPQTDFVGVTSFSYIVSDGNKTSNSANVTVNVIAIPHDDTLIEQLLAQIQSLLDKVLNLENEITLLQEENNALLLKNAELEDIIANSTSTDNDDDNKVIVCHKGKNSLSISKNALPAHIKHGDVVGECDNKISPKNEFKNQIKELKYDFKIAQKELKNEFKSQEKDLKKQFKELKKEKKSKDKHNENDDD